MANTVFIIDERNTAHLMETHRRNEDMAFCDLAERIERPIEVCEWGIAEMALNTAMRHFTEREHCRVVEAYA